MLFNPMEDLMLSFLYQQREYSPQFFNNAGIDEQFISFAKSKGVNLDHHKDEPAFREAFWRLVSKGLAVPGSSNRGGGDKLPWVSITEYGKKCIEEDKMEIHDPIGFVGSIKNRISTLDPVVEMYIDEAIGSFTSRNYLSCMVMVGGALEKTLLDLTTIFGETLNKEKKDTYTKIVLVKKKIKTRLEAFLSFLDQHKYKEKMDLPMKEKLETVLPAIAGIIRITRNEVGHPTGRTIEREEAEANLLLMKEGVIFSSKLLDKINTLNHNYEHHIS